ncbi:MAG: GDP-mannose 4,6-dehydratase [Motiliproteus sp.]
MKTALVTGVTGQDGAHIAAYLLADGWEVYGGFRRGSSSTTWRMDYLGITDQVHLVECQLNEAQNLIQLLQDIKPDAVFHLAGESFVADSFKYPGVTLDVNTHGTLNVLEAIRLVSPSTRLFCASSSEVFGVSGLGKALTEEAEFRPANPYAISKLSALHFVRLYRERYGLFACSGILFNHEGPLRGRSFVTRKITHNIARLKVEGGEPFDLGDLDAARDWGAADDYVRAMCSMLEMEQAVDLIIASGKLTKVRDFLSRAAASAGFDPVFEGSAENEICIDGLSGKVLARVSPKYYRPQDTPPMLGDASKIKSLTGWSGSRSLELLVGEMVDADITRWKNGLTHV